MFLTPALWKHELYVSRCHIYTVTFTSFKVPSLTPLPRVNSNNFCTLNIARLSCKESLSRTVQQIVVLKNVSFFPSRPPTSFPWFTSPLKALRHIIWGRYKWYIIGFLLFLIIVSLIAFFIYAAPVSELC